MLMERWNGTAWVTVPMSDTGYTSSILMAVVAVAPNDVWAAGSYRPQGTTYDKTLVMHWDGAVWSVVLSPDPDSYSNRFTSITAVSANDIWGVGYYYNSANIVKTFTQHWDGTAWSLISSPNVGALSNQLEGVTAVSANDIWAAGYYRNATIDAWNTLTMHWDGAAWTVVQSPNRPNHSAFSDIKAVAANDVWATGYSSDGVYQTLIEHWNGIEWGIVTSPNIGTEDNELYAVSAISANDVWAAGYKYDPDPNVATSVLALHWDGASWSVIPAADLGADSSEIRDLSPGPGGIWGVGSAVGGGGHARTLAERWNGTSWGEVTTPNLGVLDNRFYSISAVSANDVWAVGSEYSTLIEHWNGTRWNIVPGPSPEPDSSSLKDVDAVSANDVWAVGSYNTGTSYDNTYIIRWNGTAWSLVPSPNEGTRSNILSGVKSVAANDVWAVGFYYDDTTGKQRTLIVHWNGTAWAIVPSPNLGTDNNSLWDISAVAADDIWATGFYGPNNSTQTLILHWDGALWSIVSSLGPGSVANSLVGVSADSANNAWAVGGYSNDGTYFHTLIEHWDGTTWTIVPGPNLGIYDVLLDVAARTSNDAWAVGATIIDPSHMQTLVAHWDGSNWSVVPSPNPPGLNLNILYGVDTLDVEGVWAAGYSDLGGDSYATLTERYTCAPPPTVTPQGTPTLQGTPTVTPQGTPTACPVQFADVPQGSTFYDFVRCLACRGVVSGYADGTFGPNNPVTRGQLSKIVSNSAGFAEPHSEQSFADVTVGSTFHQFIERLSSRGYISGYRCGGASEPCSPANLPYFRPNASVTRGQTSKIVASASGLPSPPPGQQTFEDVAIGSTFWEWIEALATNGAISGYACGNMPSEPCKPPGNRPYFRPNANVTRGQSAKIVANTFFPSCSP